MSTLKELAGKCKGSVMIEINGNRDIYSSVAGYIIEVCGIEEVSDDVKQKMIELNTIVELHFYPDTPVGFYKVIHYDVDLAIDEAIKLLTA